jgi:hypothetical protein
MADTAPLRATRERARLAAPFAANPTPLPTCSICLRVRYQDRWVEAESVIQLVRSFDSPIPPRLLPAICDRCTAAIADRRGREPQHVGETPAPSERAFSKAVLRFSDRPTLMNFAVYRFASRELERAGKPGSRRRTG